jgi:hypothetical protein
MRCGRVSTPCSSRNAACGEGGPDVAELLGAQLGEEAVLAEVVPPADPAVGGTGSVIWGKFPLPQSNVPALDDHAPRVVP